MIAGRPPREAAAEQASLLRESIERRISAGSAFFEQHAAPIAACAAEMADRFFARATLLVFGSGAGTTDAQHNSVEYVHPVLPGCRALPALSLTNDAATVTGLFGRDPVRVFAHQVEVLGAPGDIALALGDLPLAAPVQAGLRAAQDRGLLTVALLAGHGASRGCADHVFAVSCDDPMLTQELQLATYHILWELVHIVLNHRGIPAPVAG